MAVSVPMPRLGESVSEGTVTRWLKQEGERVEADEPLLEVSTDKVDTEIPSPVSGVLQSILVQEDETVEVGVELAVIDETGAAGGDAAASEQPAEEPAAQESAAEPEAATEPEPAAQPEAPAQPEPEQPAAQEPAPQQQPAAAAAVPAQPSGEAVDLVVLGAGSGGYAAALRAAELGMSVVMVEKDKVGGTCLHVGCIPTKALLHAAEVVDVVKESEQFGVHGSFDRVEMTEVNSYKDKVVSGLYKGLTGLVKSRKIEVVEGTGRLVSPTAVEVTLADGGTRQVEGRHVLLATGSVPRSLPGLEIDHTRVITSDDALELDTIPGSVAILGAGAIGCEFASVWRAFGAEVTILEALPHLVPLEEESSSKLLERAFRKRGIKQELGARFESVEHTDSGVRISLEGGKTLEAELLLVAVGRGPVSQDLGYEQVGVEMERGFVKVDAYLQTSVPTISAVGDLIPTLQLAHVGFAEGILVAERLAGLPVTPIDYDGVPRVTYSSPEVASVGITSAVAKERGYDVVEATYDLAGNGKARILGTAGAVKVLSSKDGPVLGVHMVGERVGELIAEAQLITNWEALPSEVAQLIHPHPTMSEAVGEAHLALAGKPLHSHS
jgi:dihydrolipoamide dehydrogenase